MYDNFRGVYIVAWERKHLPLKQQSLGIWSCISSLWPEMELLFDFVASKVYAPETNIAFENRSSQNETSLPTIDFQMLLLLVSGRVDLFEIEIWGHASHLKMRSRCWSYNFLPVGLCASSMRCLQWLGHTWIIDCKWDVNIYHLESRWRNSHALVYHGPLQIATFWEWLAIDFYYGVAGMLCGSETSRKWQ